MRFPVELQQELLHRIKTAPNECISFPEHTDRDGHSIQVSVDNVHYVLARWLWVEARSKILPKWFILPDPTKCSTPGCQNPWHRRQHYDPFGRPRKVKPVRHARGITAANAAKTHCPKGHPYTKKNTYTRLLKNGRRKRQCRRCAIDRAQARRDAAREAAE